MNNIKYIDGDITKFDIEFNTIVPHVVNNQGLMGTGVAYALYRKWPNVKSEYLEWSNDPRSFQLGQTQFVRCEGAHPSFWVANMIAQRYPGGYMVSNKYIRPIMLEALEECMLRVKRYALLNNSKIVAPMFGSDRAGGDWELEIEPMIKSLWSDLDVTIISWSKNV